jgi:hypothetical protein
MVSKTASTARELLTMAVTATSRCRVGDTVRYFQRSEQRPGGSSHGGSRDDSRQQIHLRGTRSRVDLGCRCRFVVSGVWCLE